MGLDPVSSVAEAVDTGLKLAAQVENQTNAPDVKAAAVAQEVQDLKDAINRAIEKGDLDTIRRLCA